ncbi:amino acid adenylation domain-containing protein [Actinophytocola oryzae]|uniref:L-prolyl-[peptidyl carrier protein] synthetase n=1 Tax=Actinophytocola oryzae TaxID=502181 RepID=A0A4R7VQJ7_9PSEU|nr:amino acid adenylation domain-containing protein [Actinophytocola oryzae]TDV52023.1 L-prolyl-[peptidyl carrier protein] synthetase [Actinophytocola oryzae]
MNLQDLVIASARRDPLAEAVRGPSERLTYGELDRLADRYAVALAGHGVGRGDRVLIWCEKSVEAVALMQAALRMGAVYVPVAPSNPVARLDRITASCLPVLVVTDEDGARKADAAGWTNAPLATFDDLGATSGPAPDHPTDISADSPAYILYTSGSTGEPKGVCISHRNALAFVEWAAAEVGLHAGDRLANHAPFNFDLSVFDLYGAFLAGASVHLVPGAAAYAPEQLVELLDGITVWYSVPSVLLLMMRQGGLMARHAPESLRVCVFAGEPFPVGDVLELRAAWPQVRLFNWYGPTETNVCTSYEVTDVDLARTRPLPIGTACSGDRVWLDEGEIVVDGPTVMLGYWGGPRHVGPYRTGDLGRYDETGRLEYVGRRDHMVKVRGHRVELGEIETALRTHEAVDQAVVLVHGTGMATRIEAVVVAHAGMRPTLIQLKRLCASRLPAYMIVDELRLVDELPRTENGKTDRAALVAEKEKVDVGH